jgi:hypothetical protein
MYCSAEVSPMMNQRITGTAGPSVMYLHKGGQESVSTHGFFLFPSLSALIRASVLAEGSFSASDIGAQGGGTDAQGGE